MAPSQIVPRLAQVVAFVMAGISVFTGLTGPVVLLPLALIPLFAGIGIVRRRVWSAYGFALYLVAQLLLLPVVSFRRGHGPNSPFLLVLSAVLLLLLAFLFFRAGLWLERNGAKRGRVFLWIGVAALPALPLLFLQTFAIPTGAMEDTILAGDRLLVRCFPLLVPARGDTIVFLYPPDRRQIFVKRVIGVAGDRIRIGRKMVYRNGTPLSEPYAVHKTAYEDPFRDDFPSAPIVALVPQANDMLMNHVVKGEVVVPPGMYFVLGDNRDMSLDSRYWGFIGQSDLIGKPVLVYDSDDRARNGQLNRWSFRPFHTRWRRLFKLL